MKINERAKYKDCEIVERKTCPHCGCDEWFDAPKRYVCIECGREHDKKWDYSAPSELDFEDQA